MAQKNGFTLWDEEFDQQHFTPEELADSDVEAERIMALFDVRESQDNLSALPGKANRTSWIRHWKG